MSQNTLLVVTEENGKVEVSLNVKDLPDAFVIGILEQVKFNILNSQEPAIKEAIEPSKKYEA
jgi:hypothetical protein